MQVKTRISTDPIAEELSMKSNEVLKILMAIAAFQVHCIELLNNKKIQLISKGILQTERLIPWRVRKTETKIIQLNRFIYMK